MTLPTYSLSTIKKDIRRGNYFVTNSARVSSIAIGLDVQDIKAIGSDHREDNHHFL